MSREISIWIDDRWYDALSRHLKGETLEEHLENVIDEMCSGLPRQEYERISALIWQEQQQARQEQEAARRFAVFHVTEDGNSIYFLAEKNYEDWGARTIMFLDRRRQAARAGRRAGISLRQERAPCGGRLLRGGHRAERGTRVASGAGDVRRG